VRRNGPSRPGRLAQPAERAAHVAGQDEEAFDQAGDQHRDHHQRDLADHLADDVADHENREERGDRGERGAGHRRHHAQHALLGGVLRRHALLVQGRGVLADHDRVVDHDADRQNHGEQADHVDGLAVQPQHREHGE
jgi:hypothetical protein